MITYYVYALTNGPATATALVSELLRVFRGVVDGLCFDPCGEYFVVSMYRADVVLYVGKRIVTVLVRWDFLTEPTVAAILSIVRRFGRLLQVSVYVDAVTVVVE